MIWPRCAFVVQRAKYALRVFAVRCAFVCVQSGLCFTRVCQCINWSYRREGDVAGCMWLWWTGIGRLVMRPICFFPSHRLVSCHWSEQLTSSPSSLLPPLMDRKKPDHQARNGGGVGGGCISKRGKRRKGLKASVPSVASSVNCA